ncbi:MAG: acetyl-CoA carboxylase carboxyltransferase subunit alpha [Acidobacteria bacterium]|nr:acetyl-CoA carboxylase carboxyltransferase subunit alpha [Acidobacteriota bacterium]
MSIYFLPFEKELAGIYNKLETALAFDKIDEANQLEDKINRLRENIYSNLDEWQVAQVARHPNRPYTIDYIEGLIEDFTELHGDRNFADDPAIVGGIGRFHGKTVCVIGHQKGHDTKEKIARNFGMPRPEGYRKALRLMKLAEKFSIPIITLVDTPGAYPGIDAEERGQAEAIARNLREMATLEVPVITVIIGEGGSGGALGIAVANRVLMLQYSIYSVISPEGCASILWKDAAKAEEAAKALKFTAGPLKEFGIVDEIIPEPVGGAHANPKEIIRTTGEYLHRQLEELNHLKIKELQEQRYRKFRQIGKIIKVEQNV